MVHSPALGSFLPYLLSSVHGGNCLQHGLRMFLKEAQPPPPSLSFEVFPPQLFPHYEAPRDREAGSCYDKTGKPGLKTQEPSQDLQRCPKVGDGPV